MQRTGFVVRRAWAIAAGLALSFPLLAQQPAQQPAQQSADSTPAALSALADRYMKQRSGERPIELARSAAERSVPPSADLEPDGAQRLARAASIFASYSDPDPIRVADYTQRIDALGSSAWREGMQARQSLIQAFTLTGLYQTALGTVAKELIANASRLSADQRDSVGYAIAAAYSALADLSDARGTFDSSAAILRAGIAQLGEKSSAAGRLKGTLARYALIGQRAPAIDPPHWLNVASPRPVPSKSGVTLIEFSAHWCIPCAKSYPAVRALYHRYAARGLSAVLVTETYGYFEKEAKLPIPDELARDSSYFLVKHRLPFALAVYEGSQREPGSKGGSESPIARPYAVHGVPTFVVVDREGIIRYANVGYTIQTQTAVENLIDRLLPE